ncbi:7TM chemoreceptor, partial [Ostertagia ostertagi]
MIECDDFDEEIDSYLNIMHSLCISALFMNLFALYCIVFKSTKQMGAYKWYLLAYQMVSTVFDIVYTGVTLPVIFFPITMGYPAGWIAHWLSISTYASIIMVVLICSLLAASILNLFHYRCHLVTPTRHFLKSIDNGENSTAWRIPKYWSVIYLLIYQFTLGILMCQICYISSSASSFHFIKSDTDYCDSCPPGHPYTSDVCVLGSLIVPFYKKKRTFIPKDKTYAEALSSLPLYS